VNDPDLDLISRLTEEERSEFILHTQSWNKNDYTSALKALFTEVPVSMEQFLEDPRYVGGSENWFPVIKRLAIDFEHPGIREGFFGMGKGSGKSIMAALCMVRGVYELLCFRSWRSVFKQSVGDIYIVNLSTSRPQARGVIFKYFKHLLDSSPWFRGKYKALTEEVRIKNGVMALCGHSGSVVWSGYPIYRGVLDEADMMRGGKGHAKAESLFEMLVTQARPRFPGWYKVSVISAIVDSQGFMMDHINRIQKDGQKVEPIEFKEAYGRQFATAEG